jgi:hypothetical protein
MLSGLIAQTVHTTPKAVKKTDPSHFFRAIFCSFERLNYYVALLYRYLAFMQLHRIHLIKKITSTSIIIVLLIGCAPILPKVELPYRGDPPLVTYSEIIETSGDKKINYNNAMKRFMELYPKSKIINDDEYNCHFCIKGYSLYNYRKDSLKFTYLLNFQGYDDQCNITLNQIKILKGKLEGYHLRESRRTRKKLNPTFEDIHKKITNLMSELAKQLK